MFRTITTRDDNSAGLADVSPSCSRVASSPAAAATANLWRHSWRVLAYNSPDGGKSGKGCQIWNGDGELWASTRRFSFDVRAVFPSYRISASLCTSDMRSTTLFDGFYYIGRYSWRFLKVINVMPRLSCIPCVQMTEIVCTVWLWINH